MSPASEIERRLHEVFRYDPIAVPNPAGPHPPELVCEEVNGGLCEKAESCPQCRTLVANVWVELKQRKLGDRAELPLLAFLGDADLSTGRSFFLADYFGKGGLQVTMDTEDRDTYCHIREENGLPVVSTALGSWRRVTLRCDQARVDFADSNQHVDFSMFQLHGCR